MAKILIVEDDQAMSDSISDWMRHELHQVEAVSNGHDALLFLKTYQYDVVILDWQLPEMSGVEILKQFRAGRGSTPVIMLTGKGKIGDKEAGFGAGADDYLTKPFDARELVLRVQALLRRKSVNSDNVLEYLDLRMEPQTFTVTRAGQEISLTAKECALLEHLMRHPHQLFSAEALLDKVWGSEASVSIEAVRVSMQRLRNKIDWQGARPLITNIRGAGYRLGGS